MKIKKFKTDTSLYSMLILKRFGIASFGLVGKSLFSISTALGSPQKKRREKSLLKCINYLHVKASKDEKKAFIAQTGETIDIFRFFLFFNCFHFLVSLDGIPGYVLFFCSVRVSLLDLEKST